VDSDASKGELVASLRTLSFVKNSLCSGGQFDHPHKFGTEDEGYYEVIVDCCWQF